MVALDSQKKSAEYLVGKYSVSVRKTSKVLGLIRLSRPGLAAFYVHKGILIDVRANCGGDLSGNMVISDFMLAFVVEISLQFTANQETSGRDTSGSS